MLPKMAIISFDSPCTPVTPPTARHLTFLSALPEISLVCSHSLSADSSIVS